MNSEKYEILQRGFLGFIEAIPKKRGILKFFLQMVDLCAREESAQFTW
jgi:hypothetical protein